MAAARMGIAKDSSVCKSFSEIRSMANALCDMIVAAASWGQALYDTEKATLERVLQIGKEAMNSLLQLQGNGDLGESVVTDNGATLKRSGTPCDRRLRTIFGEHRFRQFVYARGANRKIELRPVDARLTLSARICWRNSHSCFASIRRSGRPRPTCNLFSAKCFPWTPWRRFRSCPDDYPAFGNGKAFEQRKLRPGNRRMATLAGVYSVDRHARSPEQIVAALFRDESPDKDRYRSRPTPQFKHLSVHFPEFYEHGPERFTSTGALEASGWLMEQVETRRQKRQPLLLMIDGDHKFWDIATDLLPRDTIEILDIVHVSSYVWQASDLLCAHQAEREAFTRSRLSRILQGKVHSVIRGLRHLATSRRLRGESRRKIIAITKYFETHASRMQYDRYLRAGYPIATGVIEGACRHLVKDRMERSGMR